ncbi:D-alanyl-lipoteichoic acid biosynthesis protein DltD [Lactobacillus terrae]|uniref:D-alanyl-lipoteichoic acid biosynthesis protein DltD n=1 Tax=Lactobacillus terrae TaxID=2269374 RepID=UPI000C1B72B8|nr:D-alanyl-lipoteichoic acid biosynthesis protein DltD [Lactobacillus terrae]
MWKKLFYILGPVLIAGLAVIVLFLTPINYRTANPTSVKKASTSLDARVLKGDIMKNYAKNENYIPIIGSSELSRMDPFHPSVVAQKYHWNNQPFLQGNPGTASLSQALNVNSMQMTKNNKAVFVISPQWFSQSGVSAAGFDYYFSPLQVDKFILESNTGDKKLNEYIANRILELNPTVNSVKKESLRRIADGKQITSNQRFYLKNISEPGLTNQDKLFGSIGIQNNQGLIDKEAKKLPDNYNYDELNDLATNMAMDKSKNNDLQIGNKFFEKRLKKRISKYKNFDKHIDYLHSPEYNDFQALLYMFDRNHTQVMFVIQPVNRKWMKYTGMSPMVLDEFDAKVTYQLKSQGFDNIVDLTNVENPNYISEDTIHIGWRGWLMVDDKLKDFYKNKKADPNKTRYHMNEKFLDKSWANNIDF